MASLAALEEDGLRQDPACRARPVCRAFSSAPGQRWPTRRRACPWRRAHSAPWPSPWRSRRARASSIDCCRVYVSHSAANASNVAVVASVSNALRGQRFRSAGRCRATDRAAQQSHFAEAEALDCKAATKNARQQARRYCRIGEGDVHHQQAKCTMERSAMEAETFEHGIGTMAEQQQEKVPRDCEGVELQPMQLVQIREVPSYLFTEFLAGSDSEIELARNMKSLEGGYGLIVAPAECPDIAWCSKDKDYVFVMCRTSIHQTGSQPFVWTYEEYFPANCLRLLPTNVFLQAVFSSSPWPATNGASQFAEYVERIVGMPIADLQKYHSLFVRSILEKTDIKRQDGD